MTSKKLLTLFNAESSSNLKKSDRKLLKDILAIKKTMKGGGLSMRPDLGGINGQMIYTGYNSKYAPLYVGELLEQCANSLLAD